MSTSLKIGIFSPYNFSHHGGVNEHVNSQAKYLRMKGHEVVIITPRPLGTTDKKPPKNMMYVGTSRRIRAISATSADVSMVVDNDDVCWVARVRH